MNPQPALASSPRQLHKPSWPGFGPTLAFLLCLLVLAFAILPHLGGSRRSKLIAIENKLRQINLAKELWATDNAATNGTQISDLALAKYLGNRSNLETDIDSELYTINPVGIPAEALLTRTMNARLLKGTRIRLNTNLVLETIFPGNPAGSNFWQPLSHRTN